MRAHAHLAGFELPWRRPARLGTPRLLARLRAPWLDRELARGVESWRSRVHAARALQVTSDRHRKALAEWLERLVATADAAPPPVSRLSARVTPCAEQIFLARYEMQALAAHLRAPVPIDAGAAVRLRLVLADGSGPCYRRTSPLALRDALVALDAALDVPD